MCLEPGLGPVACAAGDLQTQLRGPGTNEKNKSLEREIIFKGSAVTWATSVQHTPYIRSPLFSSG